MRKRIRTPPTRYQLLLEAAACYRAGVLQAIKRMHWRVPLFLLLRGLTESSTEQKRHNKQERRLRRYAGRGARGAGSGTRDEGRGGGG